MKGHVHYRYAMMISLFILGFGFYIYNLIPHNNSNQYTFNSDTGTTENYSSEPNSASSGSGNTSGSGGLQVTPVPTEAPGKTEAAITVRGVTLSLGESTDSLIKKLGEPGRIDETEYDFDYYIYNNDYNRLLFVAVREDKVAGYYTDSVDFDYQGIRSGSDIGTVGKYLGQTFTMAEVLTQENETYTVRVLMDQLETHTVTGIYVLQKNVKIDEYTDNAMRNVEQMVYDLTNSLRMRNNVPILSWSSSASQSARKHSIDMAENNFVGHVNHKRETPGDRMRAEGIYFKKSSENIAAGYGTAILSIHKLFNSKAQRNNMLNPEFRYLGVGCAYSADSTYRTYITQNFYR